MQKQVFQTPPTHDVNDLKQRVGCLGGSGSEDYRLFRKLKIWQKTFKLGYPLIF